jgi:hypothetical protein
MYTCKAGQMILLEVSFLIRAALGSQQNILEIAKFYKATELLLIDLGVAVMLILTGRTNDCVNLHGRKV